MRKKTINVFVLKACLEYEENLEDFEEIDFAYSLKEAQSLKDENKNQFWAIRIVGKRLPANLENCVALALDMVKHGSKYSQAHAAVVRDYLVDEKDLREALEEIEQNKLASLGLIDRREAVYR